MTAKCLLVFKIYEKQQKTEKKILSSGAFGDFLSHALFLIGCETLFYPPVVCNVYIMEQFL